MDIGFQYIAPPRPASAAAKPRMGLMQPPAFGKAAGKTSQASKAGQTQAERYADMMRERIVALPTEGDYFISHTMPPSHTIQLRKTKEAPAIARQYARYPQALRGKKPRKYRVLAVVDDFKYKPVPLFYSRKSRPNPHGSRGTWQEKTGIKRKWQGFTSHGAMVEGHARLIAPDLRVSRFQLGDIGSERCFDLKPALGKLLQQLKAGAPIDAVNLSYGICAPFSALREELDLPGLTPENVHLYRKQILDRLERLDSKHFQFFPIYEKAMGRQTKARLIDCIRQLSEISRRVPTYVAAGNSTKECFNLLLLADNAIGVGALDSSFGAPISYSGKNSLVTSWAQVKLNSTSAPDKDGGMKGILLKPARLFHQEVLPFIRCHIRKADLRIAKSSVELGFGPDGQLRKIPVDGTSMASPQVAAVAATRRELPNQV